MLLFILLSTLAFLWMLDAYFTLNVIKKHGLNKETNNLLKDIYKKNKRNLLLFKTLDLIFVLSVLYLLSINYLITTETITIIFIYIYANVDWNNYKVWKKLRSKRKKT